MRWGNAAQSWLDFMRCGRMCALSAVSKTIKVRIARDIHQSRQCAHSPSQWHHRQMRARIGGVEYDIVDIVPSADRAADVDLRGLPMSMRIKVDIAKFKEQLRATADELNQATRWQHR